MRRPRSANSIIAEQRELVGAHQLESWAIAAGMPMTMPAKMISEMPLPMPRSVICSPSHMMNAVPVVSVIMHISRKPQPGSSTAPAPPNWPFSSAIAMQRLWNSASAIVP